MTLLRLIPVLLLAALTLPRLLADYPIVSHRYLADPSTLVHDGRVYIYCSNDDENPTAGGYSMKSIVCVSSSDLKNWTDHGIVLRVPTDAAWASHSWAPAAIARNGRFYLYFANNASGIGVASSASPTGPFTDAKGSALINANTPGVLPADNIWIFDPAVFIDDDGQAYLYFGGNGESNVRIIRLNEDMISTSGTAIALTVPFFFEAAWMHKRDGVYYLSYSTNPANGMRIDYLTSNSPVSDFTYRGVVAAQPPSNNNNNHAAIFQLNGHWYHVYHNRIVATQAGIPTTYRRNISLERLTYDSAGAIEPVTYTTDGVPQDGHVNPYVRVEAETMNAQSGIATEPCSEGGMNVSAIEHGDWIKVRGVDFGTAGATGFSARVASATGGGTIELRLGSATGVLVGSCAVAGTGGDQTWVTVSCDVTEATGVQDLVFRFVGGNGSLFNFDSWQFLAQPPPEIAQQPRPLTLTPGQRVTLWVEARSSAPLRYQWMKDGTIIAGATGRYFEVAEAAAEHAGSYVVEISNRAGTAVSNAAIVALDASASAQITNMSVRSPLTGDAVLIPGFVLRGSAPRQLLMRAVGPGLRTLGVPDALGDPAMTLYAGPTAQFANNDWGDAPNADLISSTGATLGAFPLAVGSLDSAALVDLAPGIYTTHVRAGTATRGIVLFELYAGAGVDARFMNISARADIGTGDNVMIPGFVIAGTRAKTLLIRAVGPSLAQLDVTGWLENPTLTLLQGSTPILANDDWGQAPDVAVLVAISQTVGAFPLVAGSRDAAALVTLMPGVYTAVANGVDGTTGNVLVEVYDVQ